MNRLIQSESRDSRPARPALKVMQQGRGASKALFAAAIADALDLAEWLVHYRRSMLVESAFSLKLPLTLVAPPLGPRRSLDMDFVFQVLPQRLLTDKIAVAVATVELGCMDERLEVLGERFPVDKV